MMNQKRIAALTIMLFVFILAGLISCRLDNNADIGLVLPEPERANNRTASIVNKQKHSTNMYETNDNAEIVTLRIGTHLLNVPKNYIDGSDGFQGKFGYLKIRALLPCLLPETESNKEEFHKDYWDNVIMATISEMGKSELTGKSLLDAIIRNNLSVNYLRKYPITEDSSSEDIAGSNFRIFRDDLLSRDAIYEKNSSPLFLLNCVRKGEFIKYPDCQSRSVIYGDLLLEYYYSRSYIDLSIQNSLVLDMRIKNLFSFFMSPSPRKNYNVNGVCE